MEMYNPCHPGAPLDDDLKALKLSIPEAAEKLGMSEWELFDFMEGRIPVTEELAIKLEKEIGSTAGCWMRMQKQYDKWHSKHKKIYVKNFWYKLWCLLR